MERFAEPQPQLVDHGCGKCVPLRWSHLSVLSRYERSTQPDAFAGDKEFVHIMVEQAASGHWEFNGKRGWASIDPSTVITGVPGEPFGCKHDADARCILYAISLRAGALDLDEPLFGTQILKGLRLPDFARLLSLEASEEFDSFAFEVFGAVSQASLDRQSPNRRSNLRVQRAKRFIEDHAFEQIGLAEVATSVNMSPYTCLRSFKKATGVTPHDYLTSLRLQRAKRLLQNSRLTIEAVGRLVGIHDRHYFTRWFSKHTGLPPTRYRDVVR